MSERFPGSLPSCSAAAAALLMLCAPGVAAAVPFLLPDGEPRSQWQSALVLGGDLALDPSELRVAGSPWVELQCTARPDRWRLRVRDHQGTLHEVEVPLPATEPQREELVVLASSLLHPMAAGSAQVWGVLAAADEPLPLPEQPPPLPVEPPPLPTQPPPLPVEPPPVPVDETAATEEDGQAASIAAVATTPATPTPPEPIIEEPPRLGWAPWARVGGSYDLRFGIVDPSIGGALQGGIASPGGLRFGLGLLAESLREVHFENDQRDTPPKLRETDLHLQSEWSGRTRLAPFAGLQLGLSIRSWEANGVSAPQYLLPYLGVEAGGSIRLDSSLSLVPFVLLRTDLRADAVRLAGVEVVGPDGTISYEGEVMESLSPLSLHLGLALHLQPELRSE